MFRFRPPLFLAGLPGALCFLLPGIARAQISVTPTVTQTSGGYHYDYTITNNTANELLDVAINVLPGPGVVGNLNAPTGFNAFYNPSLGIVDFVEDSATFTSTPLSGFVYDSYLAPQNSTFDALQTDANSLSIITTTDNTLAAVPEPGSVALFGAMGLMSACAARRLRRSRIRSCSE